MKKLEVERGLRKKKLKKVVGLYGFLRIIGLTWMTNLFNKHDAQIEEKNYGTYT